MIRTPRGLIRENKLVGGCGVGGGGGEASSLLPTDVGSRIGVMFVPTSEEEADMHFVINGDDQGPCARNIPFKETALYAVVDVYGSTKRVRIVQFNEGTAFYC
jgi:neuralized-like protein 2